MIDAHYLSDCIYERYSTNLCAHEDSNPLGIYCNSLFNNELIFQKSQHPQNIGVECRRLARIVEKWTALPEPLKAAVEAVINSVDR